MFRRHIGGHTADGADARRRGGDHDTAAAALPHRRHDVFETKKDAAHIDADDLVEHLLRIVDDGRHPAFDPGIQQGDIDTAKPLCRSRHISLRLPRVGDVRHRIGGLVVADFRNRLL